MSRIHALAPVAPREEMRSGTRSFPIDLNGRQVLLTLRRHPRARRISLRVKTATGEVVLVRPQWVGAREAIAFALEQADWILARLDAVPASVPFAAGATIPLRDIPHRIDHVGAQLRRVEIDPDMRILRVSGPPPQLAERLTTWLRREARADILGRVREHSAKVGREMPRVTVRDTVSRWGSCSERSGLSFSWRLVFAPPSVLDYVVAHECAHLVHMNHSPRFWSLVGSLVDTVDASEAWLKHHGARLHRYGRPETEASIGSFESPRSS